MNQPRGKAFVLSFIGICCWNFNAAIEATSFSVSLPVIVREVHATNIQGFWSVTSFQIFSTVFQPISASASKIFGRKAIVLLGLTLFTAGAIIASVAHNVALLLLGRSVQGAGAGTLMTMSFLVLTDLVSLRERGKWVGMMSLVWLVGSVAGPIIGGVFSQKVTWRWIFWISFPFSAMSYLLVILSLRVDERIKAFRSIIKEVDWVGSVLFVSSLTSFLIPLSWGGISYSWKGARTLVPLVLGVAGLIGWAVYEHLVANNPIIRLGIVGNRTAAVTYFGILSHGMLTFSLIYYLPLYYQTALDLSPIMSGVALLPICFTSGLTAAIVGSSIARTGIYRWAVFGGWAFMILGMGLLQLLEIGTSTATWIFVTATSGLGMGMLFTSLSSPAQASASDADMDVAAGLCPFFRSLGQAFGIVIGNAVFQNEMENELSKYIELRDHGATYAKNPLGLIQTIRAMPIDSPTRAHIVESFVHSLRVVWWAMFAIAIISGLLSLFTKSLTLDRAWKGEEQAAQEGRGNSEDGGASISL